MKNVLDEYHSQHQCRNLASANRQTTMQQTEHPERGETNARERHKKPYGWLGSIGGASSRRWRRCITIWVAALAALGLAVGAVGNKFSTEFNLPDVESATGLEILNERFGGGQGGRSGTIVVHAPAGIMNAGVKELSNYFTNIDKRDDISVSNPFQPENAQQVSRDGKTAFAVVQFDPSIDTAEGFLKIYDEISETQPQVVGVQMEYGGEVFAEFAAPTSEALGLAFAIFILIFAFGSVLAMGLPIGTAFGGIGVGVLLTTLASNIVSMPDVATTLGVMIGLGVGIDYALFIVTRWREARGRGSSDEEATVEAIGTAGRAVVFAGTTVVISLLGMLLMGVSFMNGLAIGASITVLCTMVASITLLPALLGGFGRNIEDTRWRGVLSAGFVAVGFIGYGLKQPGLYYAFALAALVLVVGGKIPALRRSIPQRKDRDLESTVSWRWSRWVQKRPWAAVGVGVGVLLLATLPVLNLRLGFADEGNYPADSTVRKAYDLLAEGFGPGFNGPITLVAKIDSPEQVKTVDELSKMVGGVDGVAFATEARFNRPENPDAVLWMLYPETAPQSEASAELVRRLRSEVVAQVSDSIDVNVTGSVAVNVDFSKYLADRLVLFFASVLSLSFLLLLAVFRSVLVPLKAVLMNLLSIGAAYGAVVAVFQWGWGSSLIGLGGSAPIDPWLPVMMFAIVFGLSMDYEVFLLSRVKEEYDRSGDNEQAVADGLANTARVITAAAAIMVFVFGSFMLDANRSIKMFGFGLAVAVLLDATLVRMVLVPATMQLLGDKNWWLPKILEKALPKIDIEGGRDRTLDKF